MSHAMCLFHWPVYVALSPYAVRWGYWKMDAVRLAIIVGLSVGCWYLVEQPLLIWRRRGLVPLRAKPAEPPTCPVAIDPAPLVDAAGTVAATTGDATPALE